MQRTDRVFYSDMNDVFFRKPEQTEIGKKGQHKKERRVYKNKHDNTQQVHFDDQQNHRRKHKSLKNGSSKDSYKINNENDDDVLNISD